MGGEFFSALFHLFRYFPNLSTDHPTFIFKHPNICFLFDSVPNYIKLDV